MAQIKWGIFHPEHVAVARGLLSDAEIGQLFLAISDYAENGTIPDSQSKAWRVCFDLMRGDIDKNAQRYAETCARNREKANKRWNNQPQYSTACTGIQQNAAACQSIQAHADDAKEKKENINEIEKKNVNKRAKRFSPPTVEEVRAYSEERGNGVDAQRFVDYYASNGWRVGKNPMRDWKAAVRTWERSQSSYAQAAAPAQRGGLHAIPTAEEYAAGLDPSGFGWA